VVTDPQTNKHTHKQTDPITIHCAAKLSTQFNKIVTLILSKNDQNGLTVCNKLSL